MKIKYLAFLLPVFVFGQEPEIPEAPLPGSLVVVTPKVFTEKGGYTEDWMTDPDLTNIVSMFNPTVLFLTPSVWLDSENLRLQDEIVSSTSILLESSDVNPFQYENITFILGNESTITLSLVDGKVTFENIDEKNMGKVAKDFWKCVTESFPDVKKSIIQSYEEEKRNGR